MQQLAANGGSHPTATATNGLRVVLPVYICPSDAAPAATGNPDFGRYAKSNYVISESVAPPPTVAIKCLARPLTAITDGASNTMLVAERDSIQGRAAIWKDRSANGTSASVGRAGRITRSNKQQPGLAGLDATLASRCRGASYPHSRPDFPRRHKIGQPVEELKR